MTVTELLIAPHRSGDNKGDRSGFHFILTDADGNKTECKTEQEESRSKWVQALRVAAGTDDEESKENNLLGVENPEVQPSCMAIKKDDGLPLPMLASTLQEPSPPVSTSTSTFPSSQNQKHDTQRAVHAAVNRLLGDTSIVDSDLAESPAMTSSVTTSDGQSAIEHLPVTVKELALHFQHAHANAVLWDDEHADQGKLAEEDVEGRTSRVPETKQGIDRILLQDKNVSNTIENGKYGHHEAVFPPGQAQELRENEHWAAAEHWAAVDEFTIDAIQKEAESLMIPPAKRLSYITAQLERKEAQKQLALERKKAQEQLALAQKQLELELERKEAQKREISDHNPSMTTHTRLPSHNANGSIRPALSERGMGHLDPRRRNGGGEGEVVREADSGGVNPLDLGLVSSMEQHRKQQDFTPNKSPRGHGLPPKSPRTRTPRHAAAVLQGQSQALYQVDCPLWIGKMT